MSVVYHQSFDRGAANPFVWKLGVANAFTEADRDRLDDLCRRRRNVGAGYDIIQHGDRPDDVHLVLEGFVIRYKIMPNGKRQIVAILLPGDFCDLHVAILGEMDHSIAALTSSVIVDIPAAEINELTANHPRIARALWWATLVDEGTLREWLASLGQRDAARRMAHMFCELLLRLQLVRMADETSYPFPLTQTDLGDLLGLTNVHVNRTLQSLREAGLIILKHRRLEIPDVRRLKAFCGFDAAYLHLGQSRSGSLT